MQQTHLIFATTKTTVQILNDVESIIKKQKDTERHIKIQKDIDVKPL